VPLCVIISQIIVHKSGRPFLFFRFGYHLVVVALRFPLLIPLPIALPLFFNALLLRYFLWRGFTFSIEKFNLTDKVQVYLYLLGRGFHILTFLCVYNDFFNKPFMIIFIPAFLPFFPSIRKSDGFSERLC